MRAERNQPRPPNFADIAKLIAPNGAPRWLPAHLEWWAQGVRCDRLFDECQPTKDQARERLRKIAAAARLIECELSSPGIRINSDNPT